MQSASSSNDKGVVIPDGTALIIQQQSFYNDAVAREAVSKYVPSEQQSFYNDAVAREAESKL